MSLDLISIVFGILGTVAGASAIAFISWYLEGRRRKRSFLKALYDEIKINYIEAERMKTKEDILVFELSPLSYFAFQNVLFSGLFSDLSEDSWSKLQEVYRLIFEHNRQFSAVNEATPRLHFSMKDLKPYLKN